MQQVMIHNNINTFEELKKYITFGENCRLCIPYVELMIKTGRTEFEYTEVTGESN